MKKHINNKVYNTDTARLIGSKEHKAKTEMDVVLYQKKTGEFFLYTNTVIGQNIEPMSYSDAQKWAKENLAKKHYVSAFETIVDDSTRIQMGINVSRTTADKLRKRSAEMEIGVSEYIEILVANDK